MIHGFLFAIAEKPKKVFPAHLLTADGTYVKQDKRGKEATALKSSILSIALCSAGSARTNKIAVSVICVPFFNKKSGYSFQTLYPLGRVDSDLVGERILTLCFFPM